MIWYERVTNPKGNRNQRHKVNEKRKGQMEGIKYSRAIRKGT